MINLHQGLILKSADGEYVYNIFSYDPNEEIIVVVILNRQLETLATRRWSKESFQEKVDSGSIIEFKDDELIGE